MSTVKAGQLRKWISLNPFADQPASRTGIFLVLGVNSAYAAADVAWNFLVIGDAEVSVDWHYENFMRVYSELLAEGEEQAEQKHGGAAAQLDPDGSQA